MPVNHVTGRYFTNTIRILSDVDFPVSELRVAPHKVERATVGSEGWMRFKLPGGNHAFGEQHRLGLCRGCAIGWRLGCQHVSTRDNRREYSLPRV